MNHPAIILVGYNRPHSFKRLLKSIGRATFDGYENIPLVFSIDGDGDPEVIKIANEYVWQHGEKEIIKYKENLGLRKHIISCGDLTEKYGSVIILEDDCYVSKNFYKYAHEALKFYNEDHKIAGIGLYSYEFNENAFLPFAPINDGYPVYFMQVPCSWGQAWTARQWEEFKSFYKTNPQISSDDKIPERVKSWPESSWKKYFFKYMLESNKYFVYPQVSFSTNFADIGENWKDKVPLFQVPLEQQLVLNLDFISFDESHNKYDAYFEIMADSLIHFGADIHSDTCIDIFGTKQLKFINTKFLLSSKICRKGLKQYDVALKPMLQNVIQNEQGNVLSYGETINFNHMVNKSTLDQIWEKQQAQGFHHASKSKYYKWGYYLSHPNKAILKKLKII